MEPGEDSGLVFENDIYVITLNVLPGGVLRVEAEQKSDGSLWRGDFTAGYIEDITKKTGNCKKFSVFVKMLRSAVVQDSDYVFVSLLTYYELEVLKARKTNSSHIPRDSTNNKRYLILTYVGEFDRVHYPLPLLYEDTPEPENLRRTIQRLKAEMAELKAKLAQRAKQRSDLEDERRQNTDSQLDFSEDAIEHSSERYEGDKSRLAKEVLAWRNKHKALLAKYEAKKECSRDLQIWRRKAEVLQDDLKKERNNHKRSVANLMLEKVALMEEVKRFRDGETRTRVRLRETESELEHLKRRLRAFSARDVPASRLQSGRSSRRPSPQNQGHRSSSCPDFRPRSTVYRPKEPPAHQALPRALRRSPPPYSYLNPTRQQYGSGRSSLSERSATPPLQARSSPRSASCGASPSKSWRRVPNPHHDTRIGNNVDKEPKRIRDERSRDESPGKLLKDVKHKLAKYAMMERLERSSGRSSVLSASLCNDDPGNEADVAHHQTMATADDDIDARIEALQSFLQSTKSNR